MVSSPDLTTVLDVHPVVNRLRTSDFLRGFGDVIQLLSTFYLADNPLDRSVSGISSRSIFGWLTEGFLLDLGSSFREGSSHGVYPFNSFHGLRQLTQSRERE
jgi:hypothetical protein